MIRAFILTCSLLYSLSGLAAGGNRDHIISLSDIKYEREGTHIEELLNIEGCYKDGTCYAPSSLVFYPDGTVIDWEPEDGKVTYDWFINGVYTLRGDTIVACIYSSSGLPPRVWEMEEYHYLIIDRNTITLLKKVCHGVTKEGEESDCRVVYEDRTYHFTPVNQLPEPSIKWKKKKWLWKSEEEWQEFLKEHKAAKKNKRKKQRR